MARRTSHETAPELPVQVAVRGGVDEELVGATADRLAGLADLVEEPVRFARLKLTEMGDPAVRRGSIAEAALDLDGTLVRAHVAAATMPAAVEELIARLQDQLKHHTEHREWVRPEGEFPEPGEWRRGNLPTPRPDYFDRPVDERAIVRHKTFEVEAVGCDEAAFDMEMLDHDFHLFGDVVTGQDSLVSRAEGGYQVHQPAPDSRAVAAAGPAFTLDPSPAPQLTIADAVERLNVGGERFVFFVNEDTGRGNVVYRRYDGHYGLISPA